MDGWTDSPRHDNHNPARANQTDKTDGRSFRQMYGWTDVQTGLDTIYITRLEQNRLTDGCTERRTVVRQMYGWTDVQTGLDMIYT